MPVDGVYLDIGLAAALVIVGFCLASLIGIHNMVSYRPSTNLDMVYLLGALLVICLALTAVIFLTTVAKRVKRHELIKHTLAYVVLSWLYRTVRAALDAGPLALKAALLFCGYSIVSTTLLTITICIASAGYGLGLGFMFFLLIFFAVNVTALVFILKKSVVLKIYLGWC